ncbi:carboxylating nicotinate-nucleotide diphosphorylase [Parapedobacter tibetensis]|uniref:carboxylating nicotinate-nucleotide diphosphorylase n=1 Tax=Parapedobacter tibetensis TaxID=2972951 RepID=UPI00214D7561|nr:carboxylating nicotinate-nucleotide diphosphorylase [Parapedobacter tibetensis]
MNQEEKERLRAFIAASLQEDIGEGDHTSLSTIPIGKLGEAQLIIKEQGILAGMEEATAVFNQVDETLEIQTFIGEGQQVGIGDIALLVKGSIHSILLAERLVLNILQRMSGIATVTHRIVDALAGTGTRVLDTRKTTPLLRFLEKKAVSIGGGVNHRFGLYDMILIKDNHVDYAGGIKEAVKKANRYRETLNKPMAIEVEVRNLDELRQVLDVGGVERIMLDNFNPSLVRDAVKLINGQCVTEASGGITEGNAREYAEAGVDYISMGTLTHSVKSLDMSLKAKLLD